MAPVRPVLHRLSCSIEMVQIVPKHEFWVQWNGSGALVAKNSDTTFFSEVVLNANSLASFASTFMKWFETPQNMSFGSNGVDRVRLLRKIPKQLCFCEIFR
jgi:hypothetical protein